jgi:hypothetical protein
MGIILLCLHSSLFSFFFFAPFKGQVGSWGGWLESWLGHQLS